jgi:hypothetical protein
MRLYLYFFRETMIIRKGNLFISSSIIIDGLYIFTPDLYTINNSVLEPTHNALSLKRKKVSFD